MFPKIFLLIILFINVNGAENNTKIALDEDEAEKDYHVLKGNFNLFTCFDITQPDEKKVVKFTVPSWNCERITLIMVKKNHKIDCEIHSLPVEYGVKWPKKNEDSITFSYVSAKKTGHLIQSMGLISKVSVSGLCDNFKIYPLGNGQEIIIYGQQFHILDVANETTLISEMLHKDYRHIQRFLFRFGLYDLKSDSFEKYLIAKESLFVYMIYRILYRIVWLAWFIYLWIMKINSNLSNKIVPPITTTQPVTQPVTQPGTSTETTPVAQTVGAAVATVKKPRKRRVV